MYFVMIVKMRVCFLGIFAEYLVCRTMYVCQAENPRMDFFLLQKVCVFMYHKDGLQNPNTVLLKID